MRTPLLTLVTSLALAAFSSGTRVVYVPQPAPAPEPAPVPEPVGPLEVTLARPVNGRLLVQTNRPAYVALFEIVPERGVRLVYPSSARQRHTVLSGMSWVPVWWTAQTRPASYSRATAQSQPVRYVYALASDEPLLLPDEAFEAGYFHQVLGPRAGRAASPYMTMRALAREVVPEVAEEEWAEDLYTVARSATPAPTRIARVYCRNGTVYEVPEEMADRVWCPAYPRVGTDDPDRVRDVPGRAIVPRQPVRPDSVLGKDGVRVRVPTPAPGSNGRGPVGRVPHPATGAEVKDKSKDKDSHAPGEPKDHPDKDPLKPDHPDQDHSNNGRGNAYGRDHGTGRPGNGGRGTPAAATPASGNVEREKPAQGNPNTGRVTPNPQTPVRAVPTRITPGAPNAGGTSRDVTRRTRSVVQPESEPGTKSAKPDDSGKPEPSGKPEKSMGKPDRLWPEADEAAPGPRPKSDRRSEPGAGARAKPEDDESKPEPARQGERKPAQESEQDAKAPRGSASDAGSRVERSSESKEESGAAKAEPSASSKSKSRAEPRTGKRAAPAKAGEQPASSDEGSSDRGSDTPAE